MPLNRLFFNNTLTLTSQAASTTTASRVFASPIKYTKFFICCALLKICKAAEENPIIDQLDQKASQSWEVQL
jgi:hypothetical protein